MLLFPCISQPDVSFPCGEPSQFAAGTVWTVALVHVCQESWLHLFPGWGSQRLFSKTTPQTVLAQVVPGWVPWEADSKMETNWRELWGSRASKRKRKKWHRAKGVAGLCTCSHHTSLSESHGALRTKGSRYWDKSNRRDSSPLIDQSQDASCHQNGDPFYAGGALSTHHVSGSESLSP